MIGISQIHHCYGHLVAMVTKIYLNNSFVLSPFEFICNMEVPKDNKYQPHTVTMVIQLSWRPERNLATTNTLDCCMLEEAVYQI